MTPEETARAEIDVQLTRCGWVVQTKDQINLSAPHLVQFYVSAQPARFRHPR